MTARRASAAALAFLLVQLAPPGTRAARADEPVESPPEPAPPAPKLHKIEFEQGVEVTITSKDPATEIFLAHGDVPRDTMPDPFERVGLVPLTLKLAAGTYSLETASPTQSTGHERFVVEQGKPLAIEVHQGDASVKGIGTVVIGLGVVSIVLGVVAIVAFSPGDSNYNRWGVGIPLIAGGGAACGVGIGMTALGSTDVHVLPQARPGRPGASAIPTLTFRF
jgi:hypothetical protein